MSDITSWEQSPAALVRRGGYSIADEMLAKAQNLESEKRWLRADWEARMDAADAAFGEGARRWREVRAEQEALAERGWTGAWIDVPGPLTPPELAPLGIAAAASRTVNALFTPAPGGGMQPSNEAAVQLTQEAAAKYTAARERLDRMNAHRPEGSYYPGDLSRTVA